MREGAGFFNGGPRGFGMGHFWRWVWEWVSNEETCVITDKRTSTLVKTVRNMCKNW